MSAAYLHLLIPNPPPPYYVLEIRHESKVDEHVYGIDVYGFPLSAFGDQIHGFGPRTLGTALAGFHKVLEVLMQTMEILNKHLPSGLSWALVGGSIICPGERPIMRYILKREGCQYHCEANAARVYEGILRCVLPVQYRSEMSYAQAVKMCGESRETLQGLVSETAQKKESGGSTYQSPATTAATVPLAAGEKVTSWLNITTHNEGANDIKVPDAGSISSTRPEIAAPQRQAECSDCAVTEPAAETSHPGENQSVKSWDSAKPVQSLSSLGNGDLTPQTESTASSSVSEAASLRYSSIENTDSDSNSGTDSDASSNSNLSSNIMPCEQRVRNVNEVVSVRVNYSSRVVSPRNDYFYERLCLVIGALCMVVYMVA